MIGRDLSIEQMKAFPTANRLSGRQDEVTLFIAAEHLTQIVGLEAKVVMELIG